MTMDARRLRRLARYRDRLQRLQEGELAAQLRLHASREAALSASIQARDELLEAGAPAAGPFDPEALAARTGYALRLERDIEARRAAVARSQEDVDAEREALMERRRDRKAIDVLLEKRLHADREQRARASIHALDEQAAVRWLRARNDLPEDPHDH